MVLASTLSEVLPAALLAAAVLLVVEVLSAIALTRSPAIGAVFAPIVAGLLASAAAMGAIATRSSFVAWVVAVVVVSWVAALGLWRRGSDPLRLEVASISVVLLVVLTLVSLSSIARAPVAWDARTLWWFHAEWIQEDGDGFVDAVTDPATSWAHADYPPFESATVAVVRTVGLGTDPYRSAQATSTLLSWSALLLIGIALCATVRGRRAAWEGAFGGVVLLGIAGLLTGDGSLTSGYVDHLWACLIAAAAVFLLAHRPTRSAVLAGAVCLAAAALTKNEGLVAGVVLCVLAVVRHWPIRRDSWIVVAAIAPGVAWAALIRVLGAESDVAEGGHVSQLVSGDPAVWDRLSPTVRAIAEVRFSSPIIGIAVAAVLIAVAGAVALAPFRRRAEIGSDLWLWALVVVMISAVVVAFLISPLPIGFHLRTAVTRTMLAPTVLAIVSVAIWVRLAARVLVRERRS